MEKVEVQKEKMGQLLLKHTSLTNDQLEEALEIQQESGMLLGEILLRKNYIHPHDIIKVICHQVDIPYIFSSFIAWGTAANWLISEGQMQEAIVIEGKAQQVLEQEYDKFLRQQGQFGKINMTNTY